jgi:hypothetical protein
MTLPPKAAVPAHRIGKLTNGSRWPVQDSHRGAPDNVSLIIVERDGDG